MAKFLISDKNRGAISITEEFTTVGLGQGTADSSVGRPGWTVHSAGAGKRLYYCLPENNMQCGGSMAGPEALRALNKQEAGDRIDLLVFILFCFCLFVGWLGFGERSGPENQVMV